jgi:dipeptidase D
MNQNWEVIKGLKPVEVFEAFVVISSIDRGSTREEALADYIVGLAIERDCAVRRDSAHNVVVYLEATPGYEDRQSLCLQSHLDMVAVGQDGKDFNTSEVEFVLEDGKLRANRTTLGVDNGIGVAIEIALIGKDFEHGPLELLFTTDEERGLNGAMSLDPDWITSRMLINLDSEEWGQIILGCAGGGRVNVKIPAGFIQTEKEDCLYPQFTVEVSKFFGGHSGKDINKNRVNALVFLSELLHDLLFDFPALKIVSWEGGEIFNQIPTQSQATLIIEDGDLSQWEKIKEAIMDCNEWLRDDFPQEKEAIVSVTDVQEVEVDVYFSPGYSEKLFNLFTNVPRGVIKLDSQNQSVVEISNNIASMRLENGCVLIQMMYRSSSIRGLEYVKNQILERSFTSLGLYPEVISEYPAWQPRYDSDLLGKVESIFLEMFSVQSERVVTHGGLECAYFTSKWPDMQMVSIGPTIENPHSQNEYVVVDTIEPLYNWLLEIITKME